jgi:RNA polymerase sigma-70 factor, ECF subfamily
MTDPGNLPSNGGDINRLLAEARSGSPSARNELFTHFQKYLAFLAQEYQNTELAAKVGASDIIQQTLLQATSELAEFRGTTAEQFRGWLRQILVNEARSINRHFGAQRRAAGAECSLQPGGSNLDHDPPDGQLTPSSEAMARERAAAVHISLEKLPPEMRQVIRLRNWDMLPFSEIGKQMHLPTSSAAKLWYRAVIELQRIHGEPTNR